MYELKFKDRVLCYGTKEFCKHELYTLLELCHVEENREHFSINKICNYKIKENKR